MIYDISSVAAELKDYAREQMREIFTERISYVSGERLSVHDIIEPWKQVDEKQFVRASFSSEAREYATTWQPVSETVTFDDDLVKLRDAKMDVDLHVTEMLNTWFNLDPGATERFKSLEPVTPADVPFAEWYFTNQVAQLMKDFRRRALFKGEYTGGFTAFETSFNGFDKKIIDARTAGKIPAANVVTTGALTSANTYTAFENMGMAVTDEYADDQMFLICTKQHYYWYTQGFQAEHGNANVRINDEFKRNTLLNNPNVTLVPSTERGTSSLAYVTPNKNLILATDYRGQNAPSAIIGPGNDPESLRVRYKWSAATGIKFYTPIIVNDWSPV